MRNLDDLFEALSRSAFRRSFRLEGRDLIYFRVRGLSVVLEQARGFVERRLGPAEPLKDGRQTPWRGHPVFVAQHATATCCRGCLQKWHGIPKGRALEDPEKRYIIEVLRAWLIREGS